MASTVNIQAVEAALDPLDIPTTSSPVVLWSLKKGKFKLPGMSGNTEAEVGKIVSDNSGIIQGELGDQYFFWPDKYFHNLDGQGFEVSKTERMNIKGVLHGSDAQDAKLYHGFDASLRGGNNEKLLYDAMFECRSKCKCLFSHFSGFNLPFAHKLLHTNPSGGELDALTIFPDLSFMHIESKSELSASSLEKAAKQLEKGETFLKSLLGMLSIPVPKVTLTRFIFFGAYKTRKELKNVIQSVVPQLDEKYQKKLLCQEDLQHIEKFLPSVGPTQYETEYKQIVSILYTAALMSPANMTGSLADWTKALVGKDGILPGVTDQPTPLDPQKFGTIRHEPLSSDHAMLFWSPEQWALIHDLATICALIVGPFGSGKTQILRAFEQELRKNDPSTKIFRISGLEWDPHGNNFLSSVCILDILTESLCGTDLQKELHTQERRFWELVPKYIQHKLNTESGNLAFIIDEAPLPDLSDQRSWSENWSSITSCSRVRVRMAFRPDSYSRFRKMEMDKNLGGFSPVILDKVVRNTESVCSAAGTTVNSVFNFPVEKTKMCSVVGDRPVMYIVEEDADRCSVGVRSAFTENQKDNRVILCQSKNDISQISEELKDLANLFIFTGAREEGESAYAKLKSFFHSPITAVLVTTQKCFSGMDASCVLYTSDGFSTESALGSCHVLYRAVGKLITVASRKDVVRIRNRIIIEKWELRDAHSTPSTKIQTLAQFFTKDRREKVQEKLQRTIQDQEKEIEDQESKIREHKINWWCPWKALGNWRRDKKILEVMQEVLEIMHRIQELHNRDSREGVPLLLAREEQSLEVMQEIQQVRLEIQELRHQQRDGYTTVQLKEKEVRIRCCQDIQEQVILVKQLEQKQIESGREEKELEYDDLNWMMRSKRDIMDYSLLVDKKQSVNYTQEQLNRMERRVQVKHEIWQTVNEIRNIVRKQKPGYTDKREVFDEKIIKYEELRSEWYNL